MTRGTCGRPHRSPFLPLAAETNPGLPTNLATETLKLEVKPILEILWKQAGGTAPPAARSQARACANFKSQEAT